MKIVNAHGRQLRNNALCRIEPFVRAMAQCPSAQRACMLWALASRLCKIPDGERTLAFTCVLKAVGQLPYIEQMEPLTELGLRVADLPADDQQCAVRAFTAVVGRMPFELQVGPLVDLTHSMIERAYSSSEPTPEGVTLLH